MALEKQLTTVDQFEAFLALPENADRRFELIDGEIVEMSPTFSHGELALELGVALRLFLRQTGLGRVSTEARFNLPTAPFESRIPDVAVILQGHEIPADKPIPFMPDLAVEIKSPTDSLRLLREKAHFYLQHGSRLVWLVLPEKRLIEVYTAADEFVLTESDTLTGGDVLPGFELAVSSIFANVQ
jgi:Uma2 family endonuclease